MKISQLNLVDKDIFYKFIKSYWVKKVKMTFLKKVFEWQHISNKKFNFVIAKNKKEIIGIQGFIPMKQFDSRLSAESVFQVFLRVKEGNSIGTSILLHKKIISLCRAKFIGVIGIDEVTHKFHKWLGFKIFKMNHHFLLSEKYKVFKISKVNQKLRNKKKIEKNIKKKLNLSYDTLNLNNIYKIKNHIFKKNFPKKSKNFLINRYFKNPFYKYLIIQIKKNDYPISIMVIRPIKFKKRSVLRLVDYIGSENDAKFLQPICKKILKNHNAEYLDFYSHGISSELLKKSGFEDRHDYKNEEIIVPNYFEPFIKKNIDIFCAYKTNVRKKIKLFKADGDGDRPSVTIS